MTRRSRIAFVACGVLVVALLLVPSAGVALVATREVGHPQVIVSLASHEWERLPSAALLAMKNPDAIVLLTQPAVPSAENCNRCSDRVGWLTWLGVEPARIALAPGRVTNTYDEAIVVRNYCQRHGTRRVLVVTSPYHTRRALATFDSVLAPSNTMVGVYPAWTNSLAQPRQWWSTEYDRWYVRYEWSALLWYALRHQVNPWVTTS
jgi:uncharacterized SAM-binding protein YcdF (DUF218 family)